jgi:hypothetical protein
MRTLILSLAILTMGILTLIQAHAQNYKSHAQSTDNSTNAAGFSNDTYAGIEGAGTLRIEGIMVESFLIPGFYYFPKDVIFEINNSKTICPSNQCKFIDDMERDRIHLLFTEDYMLLSGNYRLQDNITNGHFTPKKQKLVENMGFHSLCYFDDIQEDLKNGTTKYICSGKYDEFKGTAMGAHAVRNFNKAWYPYTFSASFELPSRHFVLNATEIE